MNVTDIIILVIIGLILFTIIFRAVQKRCKAKAAGITPSCCSGNCSNCALSGKK